MSARLEAVWHLYVLACADGSLYAGIALDVGARLAQHAAGKGARYTRGRGPLRLRADAACGSKGLALSLELRFKRLTRAQKLWLVARRARLVAWVSAQAQSKVARMPGTSGVRPERTRSRVGSGAATTPTKVAIVPAATTVRRLSTLAAIS